MSLLTGAVIGALAVCIWHVMQLTRRIEKLEQRVNNTTTTETALTGENSQNNH